MAAENVEKAGGKVFFAKDSKAATKYVLDLAKRKGVRSVIKGKSMLSEEMDLNHQLAKQEIEAVETDLGEYLVQLAGQTPVPHHRAGHSYVQVGRERAIP